MLSNNGLCLHAAPQYVLLFLVLVVTSTWFQILHSYTLFLKSSILALYVLRLALIGQLLFCCLYVFVVSVTPGQCSWRSPTLSWEGSLVEVAPRSTASRYMHTSIYYWAYIWVRVLLSGGWRLGSNRSIWGYCMVGNFWRRKLLPIPRFYGYLQMLARGIFWRHQRVIHKSSRENLSFHQLSKVFLPQKFPTIWYRKWSHWKGLRTLSLLSFPPWLLVAWRLL